MFPLEPLALWVARYATTLLFYGFPDTFSENTPRTVQKSLITLFSKTFKKPKHQSDGMCQLPPKMPNKKKPKYQTILFDANCQNCLWKKPSVWNLESEKPICQPYLPTSFHKPTIQTQSTLTASSMWWIVPIVTCESGEWTCGCSCLKCIWSKQVVGLLQIGSMYRASSSVLVYNKNRVASEQYCSFVSVSTMLSRSHRHGGFGGLIPPHKAPRPQNCNVIHYKSVEFLSNLKMSSPTHKHRSPSYKCKASLLKTFWRRFCVRLVWYF